MENNILQIKNALEEADFLYKVYMKREPAVDCSAPLLQAAIACELILAEILTINGVCLENGKVKDEGNGRRSPIPTLSYCATKELTFIPSECRALIQEIRKYRNMAAHATSTNRAQLFEFTKAYKGFVAWAFESYPEMLKPGDSSSEWIQEYILNNLSDFAIEDTTLQLYDRASTYQKYLEKVSDHKEKAEVSQNTLERQDYYKPVPSSISMVAEPSTEYGVTKGDVSNAELLKTLLSAMEEHTNRAILAGKENTERIITEIDNVAELLKQLLTQINQYQDLVQNQIDLAVSEDEIDRIVEAYANTCVEKIITNVDAKYSGATYATEEKKLQISMDKAWDKLAEESKEFLISSKVIYNYLLNIPSAVDYSGVCLLVTKALEVEMSRRFYSMYMDYLEIKYENVGKSNRRKDYSKYPPIMLNQYGKAIRSKDFTLGKVPFVLCSSFGDNCTEEEKQSNLENVIAFAKAELLSKLTEDQIQNKLESYGEKVGEITKAYRNKAAHTNQLKRVDAVQCFDIVIDVEKFLKIMVDSFDK